jgi:hypothetical protein
MLDLLVGSVFEWKNRLSEFNEKLLGFVYTTIISRIVIARHEVISSTATASPIDRNCG